MAHRLVLTLLLRPTANRETAEELTVDVLHDVWKQAEGYDRRKDRSLPNTYRSQAGSALASRIKTRRPRTSMRINTLSNRFGAIGSFVDTCRHDCQ
jgi:hypothetical protein